MLGYREMANRYCQFCKKRFCCEKCRNRHVDKNHPGVNVDCALCASKILPIRPLEFEKLLLEDKNLLCHIVDKHLPLHCTRCGELFRTEEDFKSIDTCKYFELQRLSPRTPASTNLQVKLKYCSISDSNSRTFSTPPKIYRNTSTPMFGSQKNSLKYHTPCAPNFSLKTPRTNTPSSIKSTISRINESHEESDNSNTKFFSFSMDVLEYEEMTPFKTANDNQFFRRNFSKNLDIKKLETNAGEVITSYEDQDQITSPVDMDLMDVESGVLQDSSKLDVIYEEPNETSRIVKKVRFSDHYQLDNQGEKNNNLNATEEEEFHDAQNVSNTKKDARNVKNMKDTKITDDPQVTRNTESDQVENQTYSQINSPESSLVNSQIKIFKNSMEDIEKKNLDETVAMNMRMNISIIENYSKENAKALIDYRQNEASSFSSPTQSNENAKNGILSTVAEAVKHAFKNFSGQ